MCKGSFIKRMCNRVHDAARWWWEVEWKPWYQEHAVHLMVTLKWNKEELHRFSCFYRSQFSSFADYDRNTRPSKISPVQRIEPRISPWVLIKCRLQVTVCSRRMESSDLLGAYLLTTYTLLYPQWLSRAYSSFSKHIIPFEITTEPTWQDLTGSASRLLKNPSYPIQFCTYLQLGPLGNLGQQARCVWVKLHIWLP